MYDDYDFDDIYADGYDGDDYNEGDYYEGLSNGEIWDLIIELGIATEEELNFITGINGYNIETLNGVINYRTGYHDMRQLLDDEEYINYGGNRK